MTQDRETIRTKHTTVKAKSGTTNLTNTNLQGIKVYTLLKLHPYIVSLPRSRFMDVTAARETSTL